jgi:hypothetical protein
MDTSKYWDAATASNVLITTDDFARNPALQDKPLCCPADDCNAAVRYRKGSNITEGGDGSSRKACFVTEDVQEHKNLCEHSSDTNVKYTLQLVEALKQGRSILFNLNFQTSIKAELSLPEVYKRAVFNHTGASLYSAWRSTNSYIPKNFSDAQSVIVAIEHIKVIGNQIGLSDPLSRIAINHNGGVISCHQFLLRGNEKHTAFFNAIASSRESVGNDDKSLWNLTAALRQITIRPADKQRFDDSLLGQSYKTNVGGRDIWLGDTLSFKGEGLQLRDQLLEQGKVILIGNPNVRPRELDRVANNDGSNLNVNWVITGRHQIYAPQ